MSDAGSGAQAPEPARRFTLDLRFIVPILIGLVSVTGAFVAWRGDVAGELAVDEDRLALADSDTLARSQAVTQAQVRSQIEAFTRYKAGLGIAVRLEQAAGETQSRPAALTLQGRAQALRDQADDLAGPTLDTSFVTFDDNGAPATFDTDRYRAAQLAQDTDAARADPGRHSAEADRFRARGQRLSAWLIAFAGAVVLLTVAQIAVRLRPPAAALGIAVYGAAVAGALRA